jgi:hypothetical protein
VSAPRWRWKPFLLGAVGWAAALSGCSHQPSAPEAAILQVRLASPNGDDGALLLTVAGGRVDSVEASGYTTFSHRSDPTTLRIIVAGTVVSGTIARLWVPDERQIGRYSVTLDQAAARGSYVQRDPASYQITLER